MLMHWLDFLFPPRVDERALRDISNDDFLSLVAPQLVSETRPGTVMLLPFSDTRVRTAIHEAKYRGNKRAFELLSLALAEYLHDFDDENYGFRKSVYIVPVPLGTARRKERGYNQIEEVARCALRSLEPQENLFILDNLLERARETISQVSLPREKREENMRGAFTASLKLRSTSMAEISKCTFIVVDDVITTGATLQAAVDALKKVGVEHIIPLALAH
ncbi:MAG: phosphoribosyltransferase family protein [Candidatus Kaiserbacteria bacterium]|nr:phosphoribosyltransferase family protein [Candidatus Kaiserbacteria bacterium]